MKLRAYQTRAVKAVLEAYKLGARGVLVQAPCGAGKTEIAMEIMQRIPKRWVGVVPNSVLATQLETRLRKLGLEVTRYGVNKHNGAPACRIQVATIQMLLARDAEKRLQPECICFDEAHHYEAREWADFAERYPDALRLGLTATPERDDGVSLTNHFQTIVVAATYAELIAQRLLVPARVYAPVVTQPYGLAWDPIDAWNRFAEGRKTIVAFGLVEEAEEWAERFNKALTPHGMHAACVNGKSPRQLNYAVLRDFAAGKVQILTNVYYIAEGFDLPDVGCVIFGRRFAFRGTYIQFGGRALRVAPGKRDAVAIDLTGCSYKHGYPDEDYPWEVEGHDKPGRQSRGNGNGNGDGYAREALEVEAQGLVRVSHGALAPGDPDPKPFIKKLVIPKQRQRARERIEKLARQMAGKKGVAAARAWAEREKRRHVELGGGA